MSDAVRTQTRVGKICYTNSLPFYHKLNEANGLDYFETFPAELNKALRFGKVDLGPISSLEYIKHQENYLLLPGFSITARGFSGSVILFSKKKIDSLNGLKIAVSRESLSSAALLQILLKFKYKFENEFETVPSDPAKMLSEYPAALAIGDDALFFQPKEFIYKYDLSELWWNWTEKPFCFAVWAVRRQFAEENPEELAAFCVKLRKNLDRNLISLEGLLKDALGLTFMDAKYSKIFGYLFNLHYGMDGETQEGLELFYRLAHRLKAAPRPAPLEFFKD